MLIHSSLRAGMSLDLRIDGHRVWTLRAHSRLGVLRETWPDELAARISGRAEYALHRAGSLDPLARRTVSLGGSTDPVELEDDNGRALTVNKWGELTTNFETADPALGTAILALATRIVDTLQAAGHIVTITSGTLLGWVRSRALLPADDDADLALIVTESESPADVAGIGFAVRRLLVDQGFDVVMHSAAHVQIRLRDESVETQAYCDIFLGFFRETLYCQPFHVRSSVPRGSLYPPQSVEIGDFRLPAPPRPDDWLAACYGPEWRTPDPGFVFDTPPATRDRYENWFGSFDFGRTYWDREHERSEGRSIDPTHLRLVHDQFYRVGAKIVLDAACGTGGATAMLAQTFPVRAFDFSETAVRIAADLLGDHDLVERRNLADGRDVLELEIAVAKRPVVLSLHDVLHVLTIPTRLRTYRLARSVLRANGAVVAHFATDFDASRYAFRDPTTWHLEVETLEAEAAHEGLRIDELHSSQSPTGRRMATATLVLSEETERGV